MRRLFYLLFFVTTLTWADDLKRPHIGYVFPAGGTPGSTFELTIGGQYIQDFVGIHISGGGMTAEPVGFFRELERKEANRTKRMKEKIEIMLDENPSEMEREQLLHQMEMAEENLEMHKLVKKAAKKNRAQAAKKQFNPQLAESLTLEVTLDKRVDLGMHELRLLTSKGSSNPLVFQVSRLPEVIEKETKKSKKTAPVDTLNLPVLLNGQILPGDIDTFRFYAQKGEDLVFRVQARSLVPYLADAVPGWFQAVLTLYDADGNELAYMDDFRFDPDPVLVFRVPEDGEYVLEIRDAIYRGRRDFVYRIEMGALPFIDHIYPLGGMYAQDVPVSLYGVNLPNEQMVVTTKLQAPYICDLSVETENYVSNVRPFAVDPVASIEEQEPNNLPSHAQLIKAPVVVNGRMGQPGDFDCFQFEGKKGQRVEVEVVARRLDSPLDARLALLDPEEHLIAVSDDAVDRGDGLVTHHADSLLQHELPQDGMYIVRLDDLRGKGGREYAYRLRFGEEEPDYQLRLVPASLTIPQNGTALVTVHALRYGGFDGEIQLKVKGRRSGMELGRAFIPAGEDKAHVCLSMTGRSRGELVALEVVGTARVHGRMLRRPAVPADDRMQAFLWRHLVQAKELLVRVTQPDPVAVSLKLPQEGLIEAAPGETVRLATTLSAPEVRRGTVMVELSDAPEWITLKNSKLPLNQKGGATLSLMIDREAPVGTLENIILTGTFHTTLDKTSPEFNPANKRQNKIKYPFTIGVVPVKLID